MKRFILLFIIVLITVGSASATTTYYLQEYNPYLKLLLHNNGTEGSITFIDEQGHTTTPFGSTYIDTSNKKYGNASGLFDGTNDFINVTYSADWELGSNPYTLLWWENRTSNVGSDTRPSISRDPTTIFVPWSTAAKGGNVVYYATSTGAAFDIDNGISPIGTINQNVWTQRIIQRNSTHINFYENGTLIRALASTDAYFASSGPLSIGRLQSGSETFPGNMDEIALWKGIAIPITHLYPQTSEIGVQNSTDEQPLASFTVTNISISLGGTTTSGYTGYSPFKVHFTNTSTNFNGTPSFKWNYTTFENTTPITFENAQYDFDYTFLYSGNHSINLTVSNPYYTNTSTQNTWINLTAAPQIISNFVANTTTPKYPGAAVQFTDLSNTGYPDAWLWEFGDGKTSTERNPVHTYTSVGLKTVNLTSYMSTNTTNTDTESKTDYINVTYRDDYVNADFVGSPTSGSVGLSVTFTDLSFFANSSAQKSYNWSFGDDGLSTTPYSSTVGSATHVYSSLGTYTVKLTINNTANATLGSDVEEKLNYITIANQQTSTWYTQHLVQLKATDWAGVPLDNATISVKFLNSALPNTSVSWVQTAFGVSATVAEEMVDGTYTMGSSVGNDGSATFMMFPAFKYGITVIDPAKGVNFYTTVLPLDNIYTITCITNIPSGFPTTGNSTYENLNGTRAYFYEPDVHNVTMCVDYRDVSGLTTTVTDIWKFANNNTIVNSVTFVPGIAMRTDCYTLPNVRGTKIWWGYNATRSGT